MTALGPEPSRSTRRLGRSGPPRLTSDDELRLTRALDEAETQMARAIVRSSRALAELGALGPRLVAGAVRARDLVRIAERAPLGVPLDREELRGVLAAAARIADEAPGAASGSDRDDEREHLGDRIAALRFHPIVLDRIAEAMTDSDHEARRAFARARRAQRAAKSEWTAATAYLVAAIARRYRRPGVEPSDLVQDGSIGLIRAVEKFDPALGHRFHVYAVWWIRQHVFRALASYGRTIRIPLPMVEASHRIARARRVFESIYGLEPDDVELAAASGMDVATVTAVAAIRDEPVSFYGRAGEEETNILDRLSDLAVDPPDEQLERARLHERIRALFDALPAREQEVLRLRFGLDDAREHTQVEVAAALAISRDRARRIEEQALERLRTWSVRGGLAGAPGRGAAAAARPGSGAHVAA